MPQVLEIPIPSLAPLRVVVTYDAHEATERLEGIQGNLRQPGRLWPLVGKRLRASYRANFAVGGRPPWEKLASSTEKAKSGFLSKKPLPPFNKQGLIPRRLKQGGSFSGKTILIRTGKLRDSWGQLGAEGNVSEVSPDGRSYFAGSQLVIHRELPPWKPVKKYHILTKKAAKLRAKGQSTQVALPLARFHQDGTIRMPARTQELTDEDLAGLQADTLGWVLGAPK